MPEPSSERTPLSRRAIIDGAIAIVSSEGLAKLSMRKLAASLGYEVMSLYNHVKSKNELIQAMLEAVAAEISDPVESDPLTAIRSFAINYHDMFLRYPWAPELWLAHLPGPERTRLMETLLRLFAQTGVSPAVAHFGFHAVTNHIIGHSMQQIGMTVGMEDPERVINEFLSGLSASDHPHMIEHIHQHMAGETGESFDLVLDLILDGLGRLSDADLTQRADG